MPNVNLPTGVNLHYETHGSGEPLVLIPSTAFSGEVWKPHQVPGLSPFLQLILHDPRGTPRSRASQEVYTIHQMSNDIIALLDHLKFPRRTCSATPWAGASRSRWRSIFPDG